MKFLIISALAVVCIAEPPVENRYLPPQQGHRGVPSTIYGTPLRQTDAVFSRQSSRRVSNQYLPPVNQYLPAKLPSKTYSPPSPSSQYGAPPSSLYGAPQMSYGVPTSMQMIETQYGVPSAPSSQYGVPAFTADAYTRGSHENQAQNRQYLPPTNRGYADEDYNNEPANYSYEYKVKDESSGNDFGHRESRQGNRAEGLYYVVLPDGRRQTVQYEADENGYKPRISYEDTGLGQTGYGRNNGYNYENQGGPY